MTIFYDFLPHSSWGKSTCFSLPIYYSSKFWWIKYMLSSHVFFSDISLYLGVNGQYYISGRMGSVTVFWGLKTWFLENGIILHLVFSSLHWLVNSMAALRIDINLWYCHRKLTLCILTHLRLFANMEVKPRSSFASVTYVWSTLSDTKPSSMVPSRPYVLPAGILDRKVRWEAKLYS